MVTLLDGPATGVRLMLRRVPLMLRVVQNTKTLDWDALDQLEDTPADGEAIYVYRCEGITGSVHINTGRRPGGGFYQVATYKLWPEQPADAEIRTNDAWQAWCEKNRARLEAGTP
jgi:hypothetical protein